MIEEIANADPRLLVSVAVFTVLDVPTASLPNERVAGVTVACNSPVPVSDVVWGLSVALSLTLSVPLRVPVVVGVNVTLMVQLAPPARDDPQEFVSV